MNIYSWQGLYGINYNGVSKPPTLEELIIYGDLKAKYHDRTVAISRESPYLAQLDGIGMVECEEQQRSEIIERHKEDMLRQIAS